MGMDARTAMPTDLAVLTLAQWLSPGFPVGAYAYSHGLEWAVQAQDVHDPASAEGWIAEVLAHGAGRNDCILLSAAYRTTTDVELQKVDATARALAASFERHQESDLQGRAFCDAVVQVWGHKMPPLTYAVAVGRAASLQSLPLDLTGQMYLHSMLSNLAAAAMRLVPLGQTDGQRVIQRLTSKAATIASAAVKGSLDDLSATNFLADIAAMKHETQYSRIFRT